MRQLREETEGLAQQRALREANLHAERPDEAALRKLDASVKRNSALTKKLRGISEEGRTALLEDIARTNQSKVKAPSAASHLHELRWQACMLHACQHISRC